MTTAALFIALVLVLAALFVQVLLSTRHTGPGRSNGSAYGLIAAAAAGYLALPAMLASQGLLDRYTPPPPAFLLILLATLGTCVFAFSSVGTRLATRLPLAGLVGYQVFRVAVEWLLHRLYLDGVIPVQMTYSGRNFDIVSGVLAAALGLWLWSGRRAPRLVFAWNLLGLALLLNIVAIAMLSTPVPFRYFANEPANTLPSMFPYIWLPTFLVQAALLGHLLVFRALRQDRPFSAQGRVG